MELVRVGEEAELDGGEVIDLRRARRRAGLKQRELAEQAGLFQQHVSQIERGILPLTDYRAEKLAAALNMDAGRLRLGDFNAWIAGKLGGGLAPEDVSELLKRAERLTRSGLLDDDEKSELLLLLEPVMNAVFSKARRRLK